MNRKSLLVIFNLFLLLFWTAIHISAKSQKKIKKTVTPIIENYEIRLRNRIARYEAIRDEISDKYGFGVEMTQANENLNDELDHELIQIYNLIMERLSSDEKSKFKSLQNQWLKKRKIKVENSTKDENGNIVIFGRAGGNVEIGEYHDVTEERLFELVKMYNDISNYNDNDYNINSVKSENLYYYGEPATVDGFFEVKNIQLETRTAKAYFITLDEPVTLLPSEGYVGEADNKVIQLLITDKNVDYLNGKRVRIKGPFFHSETEYHSTPVVFEVLEIDVLN